MKKTYYLIPKYNCMFTKLNKGEDPHFININCNNIYTSENKIDHLYVIDNLPGKPSIPGAIFMELPYYDIEEADNVIQNLLLTNNI